MKVGTKLKAKNYCGYPDMTTKGKIYEVVEVYGSGGIFFKIVNDEGNKILPISTTFEVISL